MNVNFNIREIRKEDAKEYVELHNLIWRSAYSHIFSEEVFYTFDL